MANKHKNVSWLIFYCASRLCSLGLLPCSSSSSSSIVKHCSQLNRTQHIQAVAVLPLVASSHSSLVAWIQMTISKIGTSALFSHSNTANWQASPQCAKNPSAFLPGVTHIPPVKPVSPLSLSQTHQQLYQLTTVARAQARTTMTWTYSAPWCPTPSPVPRQLLSFLR